MKAYENHAKQGDFCCITRNFIANSKSPCYNTHNVIQIQESENVNLSHTPSGKCRRKAAQRGLYRGTADGLRTKQMPHQHFPATYVRRLNMNNLNAAAWYTIAAKASGKVIEIADASAENGAAVCLAENTGAEQQLWQISAEGEASKIVNKATGKALDIISLGTVDGANLHQWEFVGGESQLWTLEAREDAYVIKSVLSGKCIDIVDMAADTDGARLQIWEDVNGENQQWIITEAIAAPAEKKEEAPVVEEAPKAEDAPKAAEKKAPAAKKTTTRKTAAKKPAAKKTSTRKTAAKKTTTTRKTAAKKTTKNAAASEDK